MGLAEGEGKILGEGVEEDYDPDNEEEFEFCDEGGNPEDDYFDMVVGALQDIVMEDKFQDMQNTFMNQNATHFEDSEECKLIYMDIFQQYTKIIEAYIQKVPYILC